MLNQIEYRIQSLFERSNGRHASASPNRPAMTHIALRHLPDNLAPSGCRRRSKRVERCASGTAGKCRTASVHCVPNRGAWSSMTDRQDVRYRVADGSKQALKPAEAATVLASLMASCSR